MRQHVKETFNNRIAAFTLVELLVVISIIALLLGILMPSLQKARNAAYGIKCGANLRNVGAAMLSYTVDYRYFPCSYVYPNDAQGGYNLSMQDNNPFGYLHWSYSVADGGRCKDDAFKCPSMTRGGAPRTNPGPKAQDWESGQIDENGNTRPNNVLTDKQVPRMAYTANAAIIPRNKFTTSASGGQRVNRFVNPAELKNSSSLILATEFNKDWKSVAIDQGGLLSKSHRPVCAFSDMGSGSADKAVYQAPPNRSTYVYGNGRSPDYGILKLADVTNKADLLNGTTGQPLNAVGRHHSGEGENKEYGGCANFLYSDGHVERKTILNTIKNHEWGTAFYSITGVNQINLTR